MNSDLGLGPGPASSQHIHALSLSLGRLGSSFLEPKLNTRNEVVSFELVPAVTQNLDLRIRRSQHSPTTLVYPNTISCQNDGDMLDRMGERLNFIKDADHLNSAAKLLPTDPINPTILLRSVVNDRPATTRQQTHFLPANLNYGNCLALTAVSSASGSTSGSTSHAYWRRGDTDGRGTLVGWAAIERPAQPPSRPDKGKHRAQNQGIDHDTAADGTHLSTTAATFRPHSAPLFASQTTSPILHIQAAPLVHDCAAAAVLAVRTNTAVSLSYLQPGSPGGPVVASYTYTGRQLGRRPIADLALGGVGRCGRGGEGMVVDVDGGLYGWGLGQAGDGTGQPEMFKLRQGIKANGYSGMVRVVFGGSRGSDAVVGFEDQVLLYDLRSPRAFSALVVPELLAHDLPPGRDRSPSQITSLSAPASSTRLHAPLAPTSTPSPIQVVSTTREVMWLDERMPGRDVLRWRHGRLGKEGRGPDRSLGLIEVPSLNGDGGVNRTALHSRIHAGVSVYTYSGGEGQAPRSLLDPHTLPGPRLNRNGIAFTPINDESWLLTETGVDGAVHSRTITVNADGPEDGSSGVGRVWDSATAELAAAEEDRVGLAPEAASNVGNKQAREFSVLDLTRSFENVFRSKFGSTRKKEEGEGAVTTTAGTELVDALERAKEQLKRAVEADEDLAGETGAAGILTGFDLVALGHASERWADDDDPTASSRLPRASTFRGLDKVSVVQAPLSAEEVSLDTAARQLQQLAPWSATILPAAIEPAQFHADELLTYDPTSMDQRARLLQQRYALDPDAAALTKAERWAGAACDQLVLDATLASYLFSPRTILTTDPPAEARVNEPCPPQLEPPQLQFSYFRPQARTKQRAPGVSQEEEEDEHDWKRANLTSVGVRMLLSEWHVGSDPAGYAWNNPYASEPASARAHTQAQAQGGKGKRTLGKKDSATGVAQSPAPPAFQPSQAPPAFQPSQAARSLGVVREGVPNQFGGGVAGAFSASQPMGEGGWGGEEGGGGGSQSQAGGAFTQVVPGAWGGRPAKEKKKGKKRVSGF